MDDDCKSSGTTVYICKQMQIAKPGKCHDVTYGIKELSNVLFLGELNP